jgi:hypothetical protein
MVTSFTSTIQLHHITTTSSRATSVSICTSFVSDTQEQRTQHCLTGHQAHLT